MADRELLLMRNSAGLMLASCPCAAPLIIGEYIVALPLEEDRFAGLCERCARQAGPELAACVEALNVLAAMAPGLEHAHSARLLCALVDQLARLAGPTVAFMNVNPNLVERINKP